MNKKAFAGLFVPIVLDALAFHFAKLDFRPMHHDEANQALKFGTLLEEGKYSYDKSDHHGPSLYYLTLPFAWVSTAKTLAELSENTLRLVTTSFGLGTILLLLLFIPWLQRWGVFWSGLCLALSPAVVYFSRFYIQETLLVFFLVGLIAALWRYRLRPSWGWAAAAGLFAGMMYATKETAVVAFGALIFALAGEFMLRLRQASG
ncbi:MAG: phospholipid carrier-dependent glycosyltransferase, partial [Acidobacteriota bacterium]